MLSLLELIEDPGWGVGVGGGVISASAHCSHYVLRVFMSKNIKYMRDGGQQHHGRHGQPREEDQEGC